MIQPLQLGNRNFPHNIIQGPLAGISCAPFRRLTWEYGKPAFSCTEMISCKTLIYQSKVHPRFVMIDPNEGPVSFQLAGNEAKEIAEATKIVTDYGADLIDLNCGCPVNKIRSKGAGSSLLMNASKIYELIRAMKENTTVPVSIKIRVEGLSSDRFKQDIVNAVSDAGADFLIVHGRHWTEHYETPCRLDEIQFFVEGLSIPVIGNGDVVCLESLKKMLATGCAGVMISRAGVGQPWLIKKLLAEINNEKFISPSLQQIGNIFLEHISELSQLLGQEKFAILQARKFAKYYARGLTKRLEFNEAVNHCISIPELQKICKRYFDVTN